MQLLSELESLGVVTGENGDMPTLNLNLSMVTPIVLAQIALTLEAHGHVKVTNAAYQDWPGRASFELGKFLAEAVQARKDGKF